MITEPNFNQLLIQIVADGFWIESTDGNFPSRTDIRCRYDAGSGWQETIVQLPEAGGVPLLRLFWKPKQRVLVYTGARPKRVVLNENVAATDSQADRFLRRGQDDGSDWRNDPTFTVYPDYRDSSWDDTGWTTQTSWPGGTSGTPSTFAPPTESAPYEAPIALSGATAGADAGNVIEAAGVLGGAEIGAEAGAAVETSLPPPPVLLEDPEPATAAATSGTSASEAPLFPEMSADPSPGAASVQDSNPGTY